jgi:peptidoglycan hydrolase-like protein with peptidoglycan-binding domain
VHKTSVTALALFAMACSSLAATPAKSRKHRHPTTASSTASAHKQPAASVKAKSVKGAKTTARRRGKTARVPSRSYQQAPTADRYKEIQQALASKGYFNGEANGQWGQESADALKRFQSDQNLMPDGKINSLSLIALGLGPKRLTAKSDTALPSQIAPQVAPLGAPPVTPTPLPVTPNAPTQ